MSFTTFSTNPSPEDEVEGAHFNFSYLHPTQGTPLHVESDGDTSHDSRLDGLDTCRKHYLSPRNLEICTPSCGKSSNISSDYQIRQRKKPRVTIGKGILLDDDYLDKDECASNGCTKCVVTVFTLAMWLITTIILCTQKEPEELANLFQISVPPNHVKSYWIMDSPRHEQVRVELMGAFLPPYYRNLTSRTLDVWVELVEPKQAVNKHTYMTEGNIKSYKRISDVWTIPTVSEHMLEVVPEMKIHNLLSVKDLDENVSDSSVVRIQLRTNMKTSLPLAISCDISPIKPAEGIVYAAILLIGLYVLITFEVIQRTVAAVLAASLSIAVLANFNERPSALEILSWVDLETLILLFSMMVMVSIFSVSGAFDRLAVFTYKLTMGQVWPLLNTLCIFTALLSSFLDNVTTILLMTPVTIRLCEVSELNPSPVLMAMIIFSNIGGGMSIVGDPPNAIIALYPGIAESGVTFSTFSEHMGLALIIIMVYVHFHLKFVYRDENTFKFKDPHDVRDLKQEIFVWKRAAASISPYSRDEDMVRHTLRRKTALLQMELKNKLQSGSYQLIMDSYKATLQDLEEKYPIQDYGLLIKSTAAFLFVIFMFFLHSMPDLNLSLGWIAVLGTVLLLLLSDKEKIEDVLKRIEWATLIFFSALFILIGALQKLGLIECIGSQTETFILSVSESHRLFVAVTLILWVSALVSSFLDNIPLSSMMIHIILSLANNKQLNLPTQPLVWALALGASLGGNGTLLGASANVVCAGLAEQHGYKFTFVQYLKVGYPVMIGSVIVANIYLYVCHICFSWHPPI